LEIDLRQFRNGQWYYEFLVLTAERHYRVVIVDAQRNEVIEIKRR
jgi:uncharacterized membrane protein YkoI